MRGWQKGGREGERERDEGGREILTAEEKQNFFFRPAREREGGGREGERGKERGWRKGGREGERESEGEGGR